MCLGGLGYPAMYCCDLLYLVMFLPSTPVVIHSGHITVSLLVPVTYDAQFATLLLLLLLVALRNSLLGLFVPRCHWDLPC